MIKDFKLLKQVENNLLRVKITKYYRDAYYDIDWDNDVVGLFGER